MPYSIDATSEDCYEGTTVLINKLDIRNEKELSETEGIITSFKASELLSQPLKPDFDFEDYKHIHRYLFDVFYDWAGEIRTAPFWCRFCLLFGFGANGDTVFSRTYQAHQEHLLHSSYAVLLSSGEAFPPMTFLFQREQRLKFL